MTYIPPRTLVKHQIQVYVPDVPDERHGDEAAAYRQLADELEAYARANPAAMEAHPMCCLDTTQSHGDNCREFSSWQELVPYLRGDSVWMDNHRDYDDNRGWVIRRVDVLMFTREDADRILDHYREDLVVHCKTPLKNSMIECPECGRRVWHAIPGQYLEGAIGEAGEDGILVLSKGQHVTWDGLALKQRVTLLGFGPDKTSLACDKACPTLHTVVDFEARGISFEHVGDEPTDVLSLAGGRVRLEGCRVTGGVSGKSDGETTGGHGIRAATTVEVVGCTLTGNQNNGIAIFRDTRATVRDCKIQDNGGSGVWARGSNDHRPHLEVIGSVCARNHYAGIEIVGVAWLLLQANTCEDNRLQGIYVANPSHHPVGVFRNECRNNGNAGIQLDDHTVGDVHDNRCTGNQAAGIHVAATASPHLAGNEGQVVKAEPEPGLGEQVLRMLGLKRGH